MGNATRYLCAAAYLDSGFRNKVFAELLFDPFRAVPPSYGGCDLVPVIAHCRRSRAMLFVRDALITVILLLGLMQPLIVIGWLSLLLPFALLTVDRIRHGPLLGRILVWSWAVYQIIWLLGVALVAVVIALLGSSAGAIVSRPSGLSLLVFEATGSLLQALLVPVATLGVAIVYRIAVYVTLADRLRPGATEPAGGATSPPAGRRLDYVGQAQWGNITMYANENPFMGAGNIERVWSIAVELDRVRERTSKGDVPRRQARPVDIDPMDLHAYVRARLIEMRDQVPHPREGIRRLEVGDHVVTRGIYTVADWQRGQVRGAHPMIDRAGLPRFRASPEEIAAIARHPQGGVRYYQRVTINNTGQEIRDRAGNLVAPAEDQEALTSAFIYLAVEGRMLYTQFVVTVLPPAKEAYHLVDRLPTMTSARIAWEALRALKLHLVRDVVAAPARVVRAGVQAIRLQLNTPDPSQHVVYPYGARLSVRELGADAGPQTYIQLLDTRKYVKLIEQRLTEAVLDFLEERKVETGNYRLQAANVIATSYAPVFLGSVDGAVSFGEQSTATVNNGPRAAG